MANEKQAQEFDASGTSSDTGDKLAKNDLVGGPSGSQHPDGGLAGRVDAVDTGTASLKGKDLLAAAQLKAPNLSQAYVSAYKITDEELRAIADGVVPPPPAIGPLHTADLYLTPGGWQQTPPGVKPEDVGKNAIRR
jgi:hypothetical protein